MCEKAHYNCDTHFRTAFRKTAQNDIIFLLTALKNEKLLHCFNFSSTFCCKIFNVNKF